MEQATRICWPPKKKRTRKEFFVTGETERKITQLLCLLRKPREETQWLKKKKKKGKQVNEKPSVTMCVKVTHSCPTLWDPMDYTAHGIL